MNRYEKYKDSGIAWIGEIPEHWEYKRLPYFFSITKGLSITKEDLVDEGIPCVSYGEIHSRYGFEVIPERDNLKYIDKNDKRLNKKSLVKNGDFIFADTSEDIEGSGNFTYLNSDTDIYAGYHTMVLRLNDNRNHSRFVAYLLDSESTRTNIRRCVYGVKVFSITKSILKQSKFYVPSLEEQVKIAEYLDWKCGEVDKIVAVREEQIKLLGELRTSVISRAVTKGLNPDAPLKDSGIPWIGSIPAHWEYNRLPYCFSITKGLNITKDDLADCGIPCVSYGEIHSKYGFEVVPQRDSLKCISANDSRLNKKSLVQGGDFIFADTSEDIEGSGNFTYLNSNTEIYAGYHTMVLRLNDKSNHSRFIAYLLDSVPVRTNIRRCVYGVKVFSITKAILKQSVFYVPPITEQQAIADYLDKKTAEIDSVVAKYKEQIARLKEYRQALITEVVTGKIDVRNVVIPTQSNQASN